MPSFFAMPSRRSSAPRNLFGCCDIWGFGGPSRPSENLDFLDVGDFNIVSFNKFESQWKSVPLAAVMRNDARAFFANCGSEEMALGPPPRARGRSARAPRGGGGKRGPFPAPGVRGGRWGKSHRNTETSPIPPAGPPPPREKTNFSLRSFAKNYVRLLQNICVLIRKKWAPKD